MRWKGFQTLPPRRGGPGCRVGARLEVRWHGNLRSLRVRTGGGRATDFWRGLPVAEAPKPLWRRRGRREVKAVSQRKPKSPPPGPQVGSARRGGQALRCGRPGTAWPTRRGPTSGGFTLIEIVVVLLIVMILAGLLTAAAFGFLGRMKRDTVKMDLRFLTIALSGFFKDHRCYPPDKFDLIDKPKEAFFFPSNIKEPGAFFHEGIIIDVDDGRASNELMVYFLARELPSKLDSYGPYMEFKAKQLKNTEKEAKDEYLEYVDPWGNPYVYIENLSDNARKPPNERRGIGAFEIYSRGPDGERAFDYWDFDQRPDDPIELRKMLEDDIASWNE